MLLLSARSNLSTLNKRHNFLLSVSCPSHRHSDPARLRPTICKSSAKQLSPKSRFYSPAALPQLRHQNGSTCQGLAPEPPLRSSALPHAAPQPYAIAGRFPTRGWLRGGCSHPPWPTSTVAPGMRTPRDLGMPPAHAPMLMPSRPAMSPCSGGIWGGGGEGRTANACSQGGPQPGMERHRIPGPPPARPAWAPLRPCQALTYTCLLLTLWLRAGRQQAAGRQGSQPLQLCLLHRKNPTRRPAPTAPL